MLLQKTVFSGDSLDYVKVGHRQDVGQGEAQVVSCNYYEEKE